jgi:hypothetical protein
MAIDNYPKPRLPISNAMWRYNAVGGETTLSGYDSFGQPLQYTVNSEQFFLNGVMLVRNVDYAATTGTTLTEITALSAGDFVEVLTYSNFNVATLSATNLTGKVLNSQLDKPSILFGSNTVNLGDTVTSLSGLTIDGINNAIRTNRGATNPSTNLTAGDLFWNTTVNALQLYNGTSWTSFAPPGSPTIGTATDVGTGRLYGNAAASITFTPNNTAGVATAYFVTSTPGGYQAFGQTSPIVLTGLSGGTSYTFNVTAQGSFGNSVPSNSTGALTVTSISQPPTIGTATAATTTSATVAFTAPASNGGSTILSYTATANPGGATGTLTQAGSGTITVNGLSGNTPYTFTVTATNANGVSAASGNSNPTTTPGYPTVSGGTVTSDATYYYRVLTANSNLVVGTSALPADVLMIAGGGGGGKHSGGGGGSGGVVYKAGINIPVATNAAVIGGGGTGRNTAGYPTDGGGAGSSGTDTTFLTYTANGGGGGGSGGSGATGLAGGSGGGSARNLGSGGAATQPGSATGGFGNIGGGASSGATDPGYPGHGGGGAGAAGVAGTSTGGGGAGGAGLNTWSTWLTAITSLMTGVSGWGTATSGGYIAGGGGGNIQYSGNGNPGVGGAGGGGQGGSYAGQTTLGVGYNGIANTGSGGGGNSYDITPADASNAGRNGNGATGIIIVRYTKASVGG